MNLPTLEDRMNIIEKNLEKEFGICRFSKKQLKKLGEITDGYNSRDLVNVIGLAILKSFKSDVQSDQFSCVLDGEGNEFFTAKESVKKIEEGLVFSPEARNLPDNSLRARDLSYENLKEAFRTNFRSKNDRDFKLLNKFDEEHRQSCE